MKRRDLFSAAITVGAASALISKSVPSAAGSTVPIDIIDTNVSLFQWPFRRLPLDETDALIKKLHSLGITEAWAGSFEGILHRDLAAVNERLANACRQRRELIPIGSVNPQLPGWEKDFSRCIQEYQMPGIRLHPNYHGYSLADPRFAQLLGRATEAGLIVQIAVAMEDQRTQHPMLRVQDVDLAPLPDLLRGHAGCVVQLLNCRPNPTQLDRLASTPGIFFDTSRIESTDGITSLLKRVPHDRVMFGTHAPFLIPEAALIRIGESALSEETCRSLISGNARRLGEGRPT